MGARSTLSFNDFLVEWFLLPGSPILPRKRARQLGALVLSAREPVLIAVRFFFFVCSSWIQGMKGRAPSNKQQIILCLCGHQMGRSYGVGSINETHTGRLKLHAALIRQPAAMFNKWKCIPLHSLRSVCLPSSHHPEEFNRALIPHLMFPQRLVASAPPSPSPVPFCLHPSPSFFSR